MNKRVLNISLILLLASTCSVFAQQGFGTNKPSQSAAVDIVSPNKGLLIPRVALQADNLAAPITNPEPSLLVFNTTATNNLTKGFYYWTGTNWEPFTTESTDSDNQQIIDFSIGANNIVTLELERGGTKQVDLSPYFNSTKLASGTNTTVSGTGTATDQYKVNVATATASNLGVVQIGSGINVSDGVISVPAAPGETTTEITDLLTGTNKHKIADYKNESANAPVSVYETVTNLTQDASGITYVKEDGTSATAKVVSANAGNLITPGTDFGALLTKDNVQNNQVKYQVINGENTTAALDVTSTDDLKRYKVDVKKATSSTLGVVMPGTNMTVDTDGKLNVALDGSETKLADGLITTVDGAGTTASPYTVDVNKATASTLGVVMPGTNMTVDTDGKLNVALDGSETKLTDGTNTTVAGSGTDGDKYKVNVATGNDRTLGVVREAETNPTVNVTNGELAVNLAYTILSGEVTGPLNATIVADDVIDAANLKTDAVVTTKIANANVTPVKIQPATTFTQTQVMVTDVNGVVKWVDQSTISPATTVSNTSPDNKLITTVNGVPSISVDLVKTVGLSLTGNNLTATVNGVSNATPLDLSGIDTDEQNLTFTSATNKLSIERGNEVDLSKYDTKLANGTNTTISGNGSTTPYQVNVATATTAAVGVVKPGTGLNVATDGTLNVTVVDTNTDNQQLGYEPTTNILSLTNGGSVNLSALAVDTNSKSIVSPANTNVVVTPSVNTTTDTTTYTVDVKNAMPKFFYMPSILIDTSVVDTNVTHTVNLYTQYTTQFNVTNTAMRSASAPAQIPVLPAATDLHYYVTYSDPNSIEITGITDAGVMSYKVIGNTNSLSFVNIVFVIK